MVSSDAPRRTTVVEIPYENLVALSSLNSLRRKARISVWCRQIVQNNSSAKRLRVRVQKHLEMRVRQPLESVATLVFPSPNRDLLYRHTRFPKHLQSYTCKVDPFLAPIPRIHPYCSNNQGSRECAELQTTHRAVFGGKQGWMHDCVQNSGDTPGVVAILQRRAPEVRVGTRPPACQEMRALQNLPSPHVQSCTLRHTLSTNRVCKHHGQGSNPGSLFVPSYTRSYNRPSFTSQSSRKHRRIPGH